MKVSKVLVLTLALLAGLSLSAMAHEQNHVELYGGVALHSMSAAMFLEFDEDDQDVEKTVVPGHGWYLGGRYWFTDAFAVGLEVDHFGTTRSEEWSYEYEYRESEGSSKDEVSATGIVAVGTYQLFSGEGWRFSLHGGAGSYRINRTEWSESISKEYDADGNIMDADESLFNTTYSLEPAIGILLAAQMSADVTEKISLDAKVSYRKFSTGVTKITHDRKSRVSDDGVDWLVDSGTEIYTPTSSNYDLSSWAVGVGLTYHF